jgi:hypothetical protein
MPTNWNAPAIYYYNPCFHCDHYVNALAIHYFKPHTICDRMHYLDAQFLTHVFFGCKFCLFILETTGLPVPTRNLRIYPMFKVGATSKNYPPGRYALISKAACRDADV